MGLVVFPVAAQLPTVRVIGDSTASNVNHRRWADPFADYFDQAKVRTVNRARAGAELNADCVWKACARSRTGARQLLK